MKTVEDAQELARAMVSIGEHAGMNCCALITDMDRPLGRTVGNAIEVEEAMETLRGGGPEDLRELSLALAAEMIRLAGFGSEEACRKKAEKALQSGKAFEVFQKMVEAQGGDPSVLEKPFSRSACRRAVAAWGTGYIGAMETGKIGESAVMLGAGRSRKDDPIDLGAGILLLRRTGDAVKAGEPIAELYAASEERLEEAETRFCSAITLTEDAPESRPLIFGKIM